MLDFCDGWMWEGMFDSTASVRFSLDVTDRRTETKWHDQAAAEDFDKGLESLEETGGFEKETILFDRRRRQFHRIWN